MSYWREILFFLFAIHLVGCVDFLINTKGKKVGDMEPFIPTKEWQVVKKGQQIPPGLHVRSNFQTGIVEAKLMDESDKSDRNAIVVNEEVKAKAGIKRSSSSSAQSNEQSDQHPSLSREQIVAALKDIGKNDDVKDKKVVDKAKDSTFRSYDDLKKDFEKINVKIRTDMEIIKDLIVKLNSSNSTSEAKIAAMTDLEYYLHQIDNAKDFADINGLELLLRQTNSSDWRVRSEANFAMASALQSNAKVQIRAFELGLLGRLLQQLQTEREAASLNRVLFAMSALLRNFPHAQLNFVLRGGLKTLGSLFRDETRAQNRLRVRMVTLMTDLLSEKISHEAAINRSDPMQVEKERQYRRVNLAQHLRQEGWCELAAPVLVRVGDHDSREKLLRFLLVSSSFCPLSQRNGKAPVALQTELIRLRTEYAKLAAEEATEKDSDHYFAGVQSLVMRVLESTGGSHASDEL